MLADFFQQLADRICALLSTWQFSALSLIALAVWVAFGPYLASHPFLPAWFTSNGFNFPLNTITTVGEWFIGAFVLVNSVRIQRMQDQQTAYLQAEIDHMKNELDILVDKLTPGQPH